MFPNIITFNFITFKTLYLLYIYYVLFYIYFYFSIGWGGVMVSNFLSSVDYELYCWNRISYDRCLCVEVVSTCSYLQIYVFFSFLFHLSMSFCCVTANFPSSCTEIFSTFQLITPYCYSVHTHSRHYMTIFINCFVWMLIQYLNPITFIKLKQNAHAHTHTHTLTHTYI